MSLHFTPSQTTQLMSTELDHHWTMLSAVELRAVTGPILWGHSGPLCHSLSLLLSLWTSILHCHPRGVATVARRLRYSYSWLRLILVVVSTVATPGEWQCKIRTGGVQWLAVANGPNIFQMLLVEQLNRACRIQPGDLPFTSILGLTLPLALPTGTLSQSLDCVLLTTLGYVLSAVVKCYQQHTDACRLFVALGDGAHVVAKLSRVPVGSRFRRLLITISFQNAMGDKT